MFVPILSGSYMASGACYEEYRRALQNGMPVVTVKHNAKEWADAMGDAKENPKFRGRADTYRQALDHNPTAVVLPADEGNFMDDFFSNLAQLISQIVSHLPKGQDMPPVAVCAPEDQAFADKICQDLKRDHGFVPVVCTTAADWELRKSNASVVMPVLSNNFFRSEDCFAIMSDSRQRPEPRIPVLPILKEYGEQRPSQHLATCICHAFSTSVVWFWQVLWGAVECLVATNTLRTPISRSKCRSSRASSTLQTEYHPVGTGITIHFKTCSGWQQQSTH